jgi:DNA repair ATPase RecN
MFIFWAVQIGAQTMPMTVGLYRKLEEVEPQLRGVLFAILEEIEQQREETVTKNEFNELREVVKELAEAQKQTENRLGRLEAVVADLAEVQKRMLNRLDRLEIIVGQLTQSIKDLVEEHGKIRTELGGIGTTVGFVLEEKASSL